MGMPGLSRRRAVPRSRKVVTVESPEGSEFAITVPAELASLARSMMFGEFELQSASIDGELVSLSFVTLDGLEELIAVCLRPEPDELSHRIAGEDEKEQRVTGSWGYELWPNAIFASERLGEPNITWSCSCRFDRSDLAEVEARLRARPVEFLVFADEPRDERHGRSTRWRAKTKTEALREAIEELDKGEFRRVRVIKFNPALGESEEETITAN